MAVVEDKNYEVCLCLHYAICIEGRQYGEKFNIILLNKLPTF